MNCWAAISRTGAGLRAKKTDMNQDKVWDYFQTEGLERFSLSVPRLNFLLRQALELFGKRKLRVLNIGVGDGWLERKCMDQDWDAYALDPIAAAINNVAAAAAAPNARRFMAVPPQRKPRVAPTTSLDAST